MITFKKIQAASQSYGRGMDNTRTPARYAVLKDGVHVATIGAEGSVRQYQSPIWQVIEPVTFKNIKRFYTGGFRAAKEWALKEFAQ